MYTMFVSNNRAWFHLWRKKNMLKLRKVSKYFENDSLQNFLLVSLTLLTAQLVEGSHI